MAQQKVYDALVIGAGPAGLSAALGLGRINRSSAVFSHRVFRNDGIEVSHSVVGLDHVHPQEILAQGRQQIERYGTASFFDDIEIVKVERKEGPQFGGKIGFVVSDKEGQRWSGRTLVMATGVKDRFPELEGYAENWPKNIYQCLFCDGWERRKGAKGILCSPSFSLFSSTMASMALHLAPQDSPSSVTVFSNGDPNPNNDPTLGKALKTCAANGIKVDTRKVIKLVDAEPKEEGVYVHLLNSDGSTTEAVHVSFLVHKPKTTPNAAHLIAQLGLKTTTGMFGDYIEVTAPFQGTNVPGVFVAGDAGVMLTQVSNAMFTGIAVAGGIAHFLTGWDDEVALEAFERSPDKAK